MRGVDEGKGKETVTFRAPSHDEEGRKRVEKVEVDTLKYIEKKLENKGVLRMERHPADGLSLKRGPPKSGHGGKYTWEGPKDSVHNELEGAPPALDEKDPNFVDEEEEERIVKGEEEDVAGLVVGEVEVAKAAEVKEGVARVEVDPSLKLKVIWRVFFKS